MRPSARERDRYEPKLLGGHGPMTEALAERLDQIHAKTPVAANVRTKTLDEINDEIPVGTIIGLAGVDT